MSDENSILQELADFVRARFLGGDQSSELTPTSPLIEWGVLNSMNTVHLLTFIHQRYGIDIPPEHITGTHLRDLKSITALVAELAAARTA